MKKILLYSLAVLIALTICNSQAKAVTLQGKVLLDTVLTPVTSGYVKAMKLSLPSYTLIKIDSANIGGDGSYTLSNVAAGEMVYLMAYPTAGSLSYVPGYYPSATNWQAGTTVNTNTSQNNLDIKVRKLYNSAAVGVISGTVSYANGLPLKDAFVYLKTQIGVMICFAVTDAQGKYAIQNVQQGEYSVTVNRIGFNNTAVFGIILDYTFGTELPNQNFSLEQTVSVNQISLTVPASYNLLQNYPNPFNPTTKIKFDIQKAGNASLTVYNSQGKMVKEVMSQYIPAGSFEVSFDGRDLSSGVYYYRMDINGYSITKKMSLIK